MHIRKSGGRFAKRSCTNAKMMQLDPAAASAGVRLATYDNIDSTNAEALLRARHGEVGPLWIVAERQISGRGRHGRAWTSEPGNFYATLLLTEPAPTCRAPELAFVTGVAVHDAVAEAAPNLPQRLMLKWPNDLLCGGAKLAGILIEGEGTSVAVGIGVNCRHHPADTSFPATDLVTCGARVSPGDLLSILSRTMLGRLGEWRQGVEFAAIRRAWLARAQALGSAISVRIGERAVHGRYDGIDDTGRLLLTLADERREIVSAGEVFRLAPLPAMALD